MPAAVAGGANFGLAAGAFAVFAACVGAAGSVDVDVDWFYPLPAAPCGTIKPVVRGVLLVLAIPFHLEFLVEELVDVF